MRRSILAGASLLVLVLAAAVGPFGAAAAAPYVYGCTPVSLYNGPSGPNPYSEGIAIYNGSATTANITLKFLAGNGTILNASLGLFPLSINLPATHSYWNGWSTTGSPWTEADATTPASLRIVSNVPVSATISQDLASNHVYTIVPCTPQQP